MQLISVAQANTKTAEFARLFDLFDRVATRRTRRALAGDMSDVISADDITGVPAEFAPVLQNLSTVLNVRILRDAEHARRVQSASNTHSIVPPAADSDTPNAMTEPMDEAQEDNDIPTFPLEERYPFTFKLMLHKLYDLDEWAEKVKHAVETSKSQFKPLAERVQNVVKDATANVNLKRRGERKKENGGVRPVVGVSTKLKPLNTTRYAPISSPSAKTETNRVLKKRCIGRRKSVSGPLSTGVWVYDAAVSATEVTVPRSAGWAETFSAPRRPSGIQNRARHQSLPAFEWEGMQQRNTIWRKVAFGSVTPQEAKETEGVAKRTRTESIVFPSESCQRSLVKRPLCI
ncbi:hypothetical protein JVU11DRAFT_10427 [Chiua virens]|nr:hypothetical protein JVU11DRAFT_10427 [Chiua virens]